MKSRILLASQSPRRRELIQLLGIPFEAMAANADEDSVTEPDPALNVIKTARLKSAKIALRLAEAESLDTIILAADTTVAFAGEMLNKPADAGEAQHMLQQLRGSQHEVHTGVVLLDPSSGREWHGVSTAVVTMRAYSDTEIDAYVATGDPLDKAGAYAIQHAQFRPVAHLHGCYCNVMGLPVCDLIVAVAAFITPRVNILPSVDFTAVQNAHLHYPCPSFSALHP